MLLPDVKRYSTAPDTVGLFSRYVDRRIYELSDHLGNVRAIVGDVKLPVSGLYKADMKGYSNYYPFGMLQPDRHWSSEDYRYGYNGKEKDEEIKGKGASYDYGARMYDPRVGRWMSRDPLEAKYTGISPYTYVLDNPINFVDPDGRIVKDKNGNIIFTVTNPNSTYQQGRVQSKDANPYIVVFATQEGKILTDEGREIVAHRTTSNQLYKIPVKVQMDAHGKPILMENGEPRYEQDFSRRVEKTDPASVDFGSEVDCWSNCTGESLANMQLVIGSEQIDAGYLEDECLEPISPEEARAGDVGLFTNEAGVVVHLEIFIDDETVTSKGGVSADRSPQPPDRGPFSSSITRNTYSIVRKTQTDTITEKVKAAKTKGTINVVSNKQFEQIKKEVQSNQQGE